MRLLLDLLLPQTCAHCRRDDPGPLCAPCRSGMRALEPPFCPRCSSPLKGGRDFCHACSGRVFSCALIRSAYRHQGAARALVHGLKYRGRRRDAVAEGRRLPWARLTELHGAQALAPVPLHPGRLAERGYNQALLLAQGLSELTGLPVIEPLRRRRATPQLWKLDRRKRGDSVAEAFAAAPVEGVKILLVDDVCTTGATLEGCAKALRRAGAAEVKAVTLTRQA